MRLLLIAFIVGFVSACNDDTTTTGRDDDTTISVKDSLNIPKTADSLSGCYIYAMKRDTYLLRLRQRGDELSGQMVFDNYQKDGSAGTVKGRLDSGVIKLWYDFHSEGMRSVMEIYFKQDGNRLLRGLGPMDVRGDTAYYTVIPEIRYGAGPAGTVFNKVVCDSVDVLFR